MMKGSDSTIVEVRTGKKNPFPSINFKKEVEDFTTLHTLHTVGAEKHSEELSDRDTGKVLNNTSEKLNTYGILQAGTVETLVLEQL